MGFRICMGDIWVLNVPGSGSCMGDTWGARMGDTWGTRMGDTWGTRMGAAGHMVAEYVRERGDTWGGMGGTRGPIAQVSGSRYGGQMGEPEWVTNG